jgi:hypothetical protein
LISYTEQPVTCYVRNATDHMAQDCHKRKSKRTEFRLTTQHTWAHVVDVGASTSSHIERIPIMEGIRKEDQDTNSPQELKSGSKDGTTQVQTIRQVTETDKELRKIDNTATHVNPLLCLFPPLPEPGSTLLAFT